MTARAVATTEALQVDFYLLPPCYHAFRRGKIQRLRDQITAWRRPDASRSDDSFFSRRFHPGTSKRRSKSPQHTRRAPYFHDHIIFCRPREEYRRHKNTNGATSTATTTSTITNTIEKEEEEAPGCNVDIYYGVTANSEEAALQEEEGGNNPKRYFPHCGGVRRTLNSTNAGTRPRSVDSLFALKAQSVDLATSVHAEYRRRCSMEQHHRGEYNTPREFNCTMEIPVDWSEFSRQISCKAASLRCAASPAYGKDVAVGNVDTFRDWRVRSLNVLNSKGPVRLHAIRVKRHVPNSDVSMEKYVCVPHLGASVRIPKLWTNL